jgi:hypothetical protein
MSKFRLTAIGVAAALVGTACAADFQITVTNLGAQPLSPMFMAASNSSFDAFTVGSSASIGIKNIAEMGDATAMTNIATAAGSDVFDFLVGPSVLMTGQSYTVTLSADAAHPWLTFASMLGKTNDGFIGAAVGDGALGLFVGQKEQAFSYILHGTQAWDAGTEENTQNAADLAFLMGSGNPADSTPFIHQHSGVVTGVGDSWQQMPQWQTLDALARIDVTPVPEPASISILGFGALALLRRKAARR